MVPGDGVKGPFLVPGDGVKGPFRFPGDGVNEHFGSLGMESEIFYIYRKKYLVGVERLEA